jgi:hypothetical protein
MNQLIFVVTILLFTTACSKSGQVGNMPNGKQCIEKYDQFPLDGIVNQNNVKDKSIPQLSKGKEGWSELPVGDYKAIEIDMVYMEPNPHPVLAQHPGDIIIHVQEQVSQDPKRTRKDFNACVRNFLQARSEMTETMTYIDTMHIVNKGNNDTAVTITPRLVGFVTHLGDTKQISTDVDETTSRSIYSASVVTKSSLVEKILGREHTVFKRDDQTYEVHWHKTDIRNQARIQLSVTYKYSKL